MASKFRIDLSALRPAKRLADGRVRAEAHITRVGVFEYMDETGKTRRELRRPRDVFDAESLSSFEQVPVTNGHPPGAVHSNNARKYMVGSTGDRIVKDDDHVRATLMVADADAVSAMEGGKVQVSCGYTCDTIEEPGEDPVYGRYDAIQTNIRGNHVALVDRARAGDTARVRMDGASVMVQDVVTQPKRGVMKDKKTEDNLPSLLAAANTALTSARTRADAAEAALAGETSRADSAEGRAEALDIEVKALKASRIDESDLDKKDQVIEALTKKLATVQARADAAEAPATVRGHVKRRVAIERASTLILGARMVSDSATDRELMVATVEKLHGVVIGADKSDDYVQARFDAAVEGHAAGADALERLREIAREERHDAAVAGRSSASPREQYIAAQQNAWKTKKEN